MEQNPWACVGFIHFPGQIVIDHYVCACLTNQGGHLEMNISLFPRSDFERGDRVQFLASCCLGQFVLGRVAVC